MICRVCKFDSIVEDEGTLVCSNCGTIVDAQVLQLKHRVDEEGGNNYIDFHVKLSGKRKYTAEPECLHKGRLRTENLCERLKLPKHLTEEALQYFVKLFYMDTFKGKRSESKLCLASVTAYIVARMHNYPVLIKDMLSLLENDTERDVFHMILQRAKLGLNIFFPSLSAEESTISILEKSRFPASLIDQTIELVKMSSELWKQHCLRPETVVVACAHISWLGSNLCDNLKLPIPKFCERFFLNKHNNSRIISIQLKSKLCKMAECIPWVGKVTEKKVAMYLPDIISYQRTLFSKAFDNAEFLEELFPKRSKPDTRIEEEEINKIDEKIRRENPKLHYTELGEDEFQNEMDEYIKTDAERQFFEEMQTMNKL
ncbi:transcription factor IIIB 50 kDa subunit [Patella vulgata]|uniref:transcription factor IIIB 50 kDa subunit n=1 Tax=Patella vulgata TaxID=6465 RepID=UPI00217FD2AA|nr:transcription factor IIIB 50 kDa subunit [Patella vulgata]